MRGELWLVVFMVCTVTTALSYLGFIVLRAIRSVPEPGEPGESDDGGGGGGVRVPDRPPPEWQGRPRRRPPGDRHPREASRSGGRARTPR
jgi:hypothetical protein